MAGGEQLELAPMLGEPVVLQHFICPNSCGLLYDARQLVFCWFGGFFSLKRLLH